MGELAVEGGVVPALRQQFGVGPRSGESALGIEAELPRLGHRCARGWGEVGARLGGEVGARLAFWLLTGRGEVRAEVGARLWITCG